jgi:hypothetical protein
MVSQRALAQQPLSYPDVVTRRMQVASLLPAHVREEDGFGAVLTTEVTRLFATEVLPCLEAVWPDVRTTSFCKKLEAGFTLYCGIGLSALVCGARRPWPIVMVSRVVRALRCSVAQVATMGGLALPWLFRRVEARACRRVALTSAWILVLDEALDDEDGHSHMSPAQRHEHLLAAMHGTVDVNASPALRGTHALAAALRATCTDDADEAHLRSVFADVVAWANAEVANVTRASAADDVTHRHVGITASMNLLGWAVRPRAGAQEHAFLYGVATLGQMMDDYLDIDKDLSQGRPTPATVGVWNLDTMNHTLADTAAILAGLSAAAGEPSGVVKDITMATFFGQLKRMVRVLTEHP